MTEQTGEPPWHAAAHRRSAGHKGRDRASSTKSPSPTYDIPAGGEETRSDVVAQSAGGAVQAGVQGQRSLSHTTGRQASGTGTQGQAAAEPDTVPPVAQEGEGARTTSGVSHTPKGRRDFTRADTGDSGDGPVGAGMGTRKPVLEGDMGVTRAPHGHYMGVTQVPHGHDTGTTWV